MKLLRVGALGADRPAVFDGDGTARDLSGVVDEFCPAFFGGGGHELAAAAPTQAGLAELHGRIGAPIARPGKVVCIGLNYSDHAGETARPRRSGRWSS